MYEALAEVGENATLLGMLSRIYAHMVNVGHVSADSALPRANRYATRAIALGTDLAEAYVARGYIELLSPGEGVRAALPLWRQAMERERSPDTLLVVAYLLAEMGLELETAEALLDEMVAREPLTPPIGHSFRASVRMWCGRRESAIESIGDLLATRWPLADFLAGVHFLYAGESIMRCGISIAFRPTAACRPGLSSLRRLWRPSARRDRQRRSLVPKLLEVFRHVDPAAAVNAAEFYALTNQREQSLYWMGFAIERGFTIDRWWAELDPVMARYRGDAEFEALITRARQLRVITAAGTC